MELLKNKIKSMNKTNNNKLKLNLLLIQKKMILAVIIQQQIIPLIQLTQRLELIQQQ